MPRTPLLFCFLILSFTTAVSQNDFNDKLKTITEELATDLKQNAKDKKVMVVYILNSQDVNTELGKYLAETVNKKLFKLNVKVIDRSLLNYRIKEQQLGAVNESTLDSTIISAKQAGVDVFIKGAYTATSEQEIQLNLTGISVKDNSVVAAAEGNIPRTQTINDLIKSQVKGTRSAAEISTTQLGNNKTNPLDDLFNARITDMRPADCNCVPAYNEVCGSVCFENNTGEDIVLYEAYCSEAINGLRNWFNRKVYFEKGNRNCVNKIVVNIQHKDAQSLDVVFKFKTPNEENPKFGEIKISIDRCKTKAIVLNKNNLYMEKR